jgi:hypothetical protein
MSWFRKKGTPKHGPDYSQVNSNDEVQRLAARRELVPLLLLPEAFGGEAISENTVYVPPFAAELKRDFDQNIIAPLAAEGKVTRYIAEPEYSGTSFVPVAIKLTASDPANFSYDLAIWGDALGRR